MEFKSGRWELPWLSCNRLAWLIPFPHGAFLSVLNAYHCPMSATMLAMERDVARTSTVNVMNGVPAPWMERDQIGVRRMNLARRRPASRCWVPRGQRLGAHSIDDDLSHANRTVLMQRSPKSWQKPEPDAAGILRIAVELCLEERILPTRPHDQDRAGPCRWNQGPP